MLKIKILIILLLLIIPGSLAASQPPKVADKVFQPLAIWLLEQGVAKAEVEKYFGKVKFEGKILANMLSHKEVTRDYEGFFTASKIKRAKDFKNKYATQLQRAENATTVPAGVIVAIMLIESDLGGFTGKSVTMNVLASQAVLDSSLARQYLAKFWPAKQKDYLASQPALERFAKRAEWARNEVLALIRLSNCWGVSPLSIKGSPAGALGWCQFMPTSIEKWGADGTGDNRVDVNHPLDAIASIARYLQEHGWQAGMSHEQQIQVVLTYNKSTPYAQAVLKLAEKL